MVDLSGRKIFLTFSLRMISHPSFLRTPSAVLVLGLRRLLIPFCDRDGADL